MLRDLYTAAADATYRDANAAFVSRMYRSESRHGRLEHPDLDQGLCSPGPPIRVIMLS